MDAQLPEAYRWLLTPGQADPQAEPAWEATSLSGPDPLALRAAKKLKARGALITAYAALLLRMELDRVPLWRGDRGADVAVSQLADDFARYLYLPRLQRPEVLLRAITDGIASTSWEQDGFAFAEGYDEQRGRYRNLRAMEQITLPDETAPGLLVKPAVAREQLDRERPPGPPLPDPGPGPDRDPEPATPARLKRFHGSVSLDVLRVAPNAGQIAEEVIAHLSGLPGAQVRVTLEIHADIPEGAPEHVVRTVIENSHTLNFTDREFEPE